MINIISFERSAQKLSKALPEIRLLKKSAPPITETKPNSTTYMIQDIIKKITKIKPKLSTTGGTSDARFIKKISPCLEFGLVGKTMHKIDEAVSIKDLKKLTKIYENILEKYFK